MCRYSFLNAIEKENKTHTHSHIKFDIKFSIKLEYHNTAICYLYSNVNNFFDSKKYLRYIKGSTNVTDLQNWLC